jgi:hypothetical protein
MTSTLTVLSNDRTPVAAEILIGIDGRTIYDGYGVPLVGPVSYSPEGSAYSAVQAASTWQYTTVDVLLEFYRDSLRDLQRSYNGQIGLGGNGFVPAFKPVASYSLGYTGAALGVRLADLLDGGGLVNGLARLTNSKVNTGGVSFNNPENEANIRKGYADYLRLHHSEVGPQCFPADTPIQTSLTTSTRIAHLRVGDVVLAFDPCTDNGRGALVPRRVTKLFRNVTTDWVRLEWRDPVSGQLQELVATPGHHFLDQFGQFPPIEQMIRDGRASVVLASGAVVEVAATRIAYSAATADQFERASSVAIRRILG